MIYKPTQRDEAFKQLNIWFDKGKWVKMDDIPEAKTMNQLRYIWLCFAIIGNDDGMHSNDVYDYYLDRFPTYKEIQKKGISHYIKISMSRFTIDQMSKFIDKVVIDARQEGHRIPDPEDQNILRVYNYYKKMGMIQI